MAASYRYLFGDLLTNSIDLELPVFGVTYNDHIGKFGNATFSFNLGNKGVAGTPGDVGFSDRDVLNATIPGRSCFWIERDGQLIWGGIIWSRTYDSQANVLSYTAETFESFLYSQFIETKLSYLTPGTDQRQIVYDLINQMQAKPYANIGIIVPAAFADSSVAIPRIVDFFSYIGWSYGKAIESIMAFNQGVDYNIKVAYDANNVPTKTLLVANVLGLSQNISQFTFDYPGNVKDYFYPESATNAATSTLGFGGGSGASMPRSKYIRQDLLDLGYPDLQITFDDSNAFNLTRLINETKAAGDLAAVPIIVPTIDINPEVAPFFGSYNLGDYFKVHIQDLRFPDGFDVVNRIIGWNVTPPSSTTTEVVQLIVQGSTN